MTHRSPMPPPTQRHPDRRQDILTEAHRGEMAIPGSVHWLKRRVARLEALLTEAAQYLDVGMPDEDRLSARIYEALSARRGE